LTTKKNIENASKHQNIESLDYSDQNVENQKDQNYDMSTYGILPMDTKACGGLG
jgi:hypothetical protein